MDQDIWEIKVANGSSAILIREALKKENPDNKTGTINFVAITTFVVYLHHDQWHGVLRNDHGIDDDEVRAEGKITLRDNELSGSRIWIITKSPGMLGRIPRIPQKENPSGFVEADPSELDKYLKESLRMNMAIDRFLSNLLLTI